MRIVILGASRLSEKTAVELIKSGHQLLIIEQDKKRIEALSDKLDCGFLLGDGSQPALLQEADPDNTDVLLSLSGEDQTNIIASLAARHMGYRRIITLVEEESYAALCQALELDEILIPSLSLSRRLVKIVESKATYDASELGTFDAGLYAIDITAAMLAGRYQPELPDDCQPVWYYRENQLHFIATEEALAVGDKLIVLAKKSALVKLQQLNEKGKEE